MVRLGIVCFANRSGLGNQTRRLVYMLKPYRLLVIDSSGFSKNKEQYFEWYKDYSGYKVIGFPSNKEVEKFFRGLTHVLIAENPLNLNLTRIARNMGIKVFIQHNYEFNDFLINKNMELPYKFLSPSYWMHEEMCKTFGDDRVIYLPPPIHPDEFKDARQVNMSRTGRKYLHIVGTLAANDRNGTLDVLKAIPYLENDITITIRSQRALDSSYILNDPRVEYIFNDVSDPQGLYSGYDALILPRRYGGLCLPMGEALTSGLPVIMTDISPNNKYLPKDWLVSASLKNRFMTRTMIDVYQTDPMILANRINSFHPDKKMAFDIAMNNFSPDVLLDEYNKLWT